MTALTLPALDDYAEFLNGLPGGFVRVLGLRFLSATAECVTAEMTVTGDHVQPYGIVHGGVHAGLVESVASAGAALQAAASGTFVVGIENRTRFIRPVRAGTRLLCRGRPAAAPAPSPGPTAGGDADPVWHVDVSLPDGTLAAAGTVRLRRLAPGTPLSGRAVGIAPVDAEGASE